MAQNRTDEQKYLILNVKEGLGFGYLKNTLLRIIPKFENKRLMSDYVYPVPQPAFKFSFIWALTDNVLKTLQVSRSHIRIEIWATKSQENWRAGYAVLGVQHAQFVTQNDTLSYRRLPLRSVRTKLGAPTPELFVTLSIQNSLQFNTYSQIYSIDIVDHPKRHVQSPVNRRDVTIPKRKKIKLQKSDEQSVSSKTSDRSKNELLSTARSNATSTVSNSTLISADKASASNKNFPALNETSDKPAKTSNLEENRETKSPPFHHYMLELCFGSVEWYATLKDIKVSVRFYNPLDNNLVTGMENEDANLLNYFLSYATCRMYYLCIPDNLLKTVLYYPPNILIVKGNSNKVIAKGAVKIKHLKIHRKTGQFSSYILLISKNKHVIGKIPVFITFQDLGLVRTYEDIRLTEWHSKNQDVSADIERLLKIHNKLRHVQSKISVGFQKIFERHMKQHILKHKHDEKESIKDSACNEEAKENIKMTTFMWCDFCSKPHNITKMDDCITGVEINDQQYKYSYTNINISNTQLKNKDTCKQVDFSVPPTQHSFEKSKTESKSFKGILKELQPKTETTVANNVKSAAHKFKPKVKNEPRRMIYIPPPSVNVIKRPCEGCLQYLEVSYGSNVWQNDELTFWCKDCRIKKYQSELAETVQTCSSEIINLKSYVDKLENEYKKRVTNSISLEKYEQLSAAQHNLTMLMFHAKNQNEQLQMKCSKAVEELEKQKQNTSVIQLKEIFTSTHELKQEIDQYRYENDLTLKVNENIDNQVASARDKPKNSELNAASRRDRCEACKILRQRNSKTAEIAPHPNKSKKKISTQQSSKDTKTASIKLQDSHVNEIRKKMDSIHDKLQMYLEERDELIRVHRYTCANPVVICMTHTIQHLLTTWFDLKIKLEEMVNT